LLTEAEWEYACRAGTRTAFHFGDALNGDKANCDGDSPYPTVVDRSNQGPNLRRTQPVGSYPGNALGLYDMHGNVYQWCADVWRGYTAGLVEDPFGGSTGNHALRGGSWSTHAGGCRAASRAHYPPATREKFVGFRVALTVPPARAP